MSKRAYDNSKRERRRLENRSAMVDAMIAAMANGEDDVVIADIARQSGVSVRTVYQHFPDQAARLDAIRERLDEQLDISDVLPRDFADIPGYVQRLVTFVLDNEPLVRAQMAHQGLSKTVRNLRKRQHRQQLTRALAERIGERRRVDELCALILCTVRAEAVFDMRDLYGMSPARIKAGFVAAAEALLSEY